MLMLVLVATLGSCTINSGLGSGSHKHPDRSTTSTTAVVRVAALYVSTGMTPGSIFGWPHFPALIEGSAMDSFVSLVWTDEGSAEVIGSGEYEYDTCTSRCAAGKEASVEVTITANAPTRCTVSVYNPAEGSTMDLVARVFSEEQIGFPEGSPPPSRSSGRSVSDPSPRIATGSGLPDVGSGETSPICIRGVSNSTNY